MWSQLTILAVLLGVISFGREEEAALRLQKTIQLLARSDISFVTETTSWLWPERPSTSARKKSIGRSTCPATFFKKKSKLYVNQPVIQRPLLEIVS